MQSIMQKNEPPIRILSDISSTMTYAQFTAEMDTANLRETRVYFASSAISENIGLQRSGHMIYLHRMTNTTSTLLAFPLSTSKNFYKLNRFNSVWQSWVTIDINTIETDIDTIQSDIEPVYFQILGSSYMDLVFNMDEAPTFDLTPTQIFLLINHGQVSLTFDFQATASISSGTECTFPSLKILKPSGVQLIPAKATRGTSPFYAWDACIYGSALYFKALSSANTGVNNKVTFNYFSKEALDIDNIRSILGAYEQPVPS